MNPIISALSLGVLGLLACAATQVEPAVGDAAHADTETAPVTAPGGALGPEYDPLTTAAPSDHEAHEGHDDGHTHPTDRTLGEGVKYTCPMHPEVTSDKPAKCSKCGMDLVPQKKPEEKPAP